MIKLKKENTDENYQAKIVQISEITTIPKADKLAKIEVDYNSVIINKNQIKKGDIVVYFPVNSIINLDFLSFTNSFRDQDLNADTKKAGFFERNGRVKSIKLLGAYYSQGVVFPFKDLLNFLGVEVKGESFYVNSYFDSINGVKLLSKYLPSDTIKELKGNNSKNKNKKKTKIKDFYFPNQVRLHEDTFDFGKNIHIISPEDTISITEKYHGTSFWVGNLLAKKKLSFYQKIALKVKKFFRKESIHDFLEYTTHFGSRNIKYIFKYAKTEPTNLWFSIAEELKDYIPEGITVYGEAVGYNLKGGAIQKKYDYGCKVKEHHLYIYRITHTDKFGNVKELDYNERVDFVLANFKDISNVKLPICHHYTKFHDPEFLKFLGIDPEIKDKKFLLDLIYKNLKEKYTKGNCIVCKNKVFREGIVIRVEKTYKGNIYQTPPLKVFKLKGDEFKTKE